jgi:endo-1,4-beta-xylanase
MRWLLSIPIAALALAAADPAEIPLWPNGAPGSESKTGSETLVKRDDGQRRIASIHRPSISPHLPANPTGAAVIILPGGGHQYVTIDNEGHLAAEWLAGRGVAGIVLKYRLAREQGSTYRVEVEALRDTQRAIRLVRSRAREWKIDPKRIGVMGFSAGGQLAALASLRFDAGEPGSADPVERESSRPDFQSLISPGTRVGGRRRPQRRPSGVPVRRVRRPRPRRNLARAHAKIPRCRSEHGAPSVLKRGARLRHAATAAAGDFVDRAFSRMDARVRFFDCPRFHCAINNAH